MKKMLEIYEISFCLGGNLECLYVENNYFLEFVKVRF